MTSRENNDEDEPNNSLTFKITTIEKSWIQCFYIQIDFL